MTGDVRPLLHHDQPPTDLDDERAVRLHDRVECTTALAVPEGDDSIGVGDDLGGWCGRTTPLKCLRRPSPGRTANPTIRFPKAEAILPRALWLGSCMA